MTVYKELLIELIEELEEYAKADFGIPQNRDKCSGALLSTYYEISSVEEKALATWIMNTGSDLDIDPLERDHPERDDEIQDYKEEVLNVIQRLKQVVYDGEKPWLKNTRPKWIIS